MKTALLWIVVVLCSIAFLLGAAGYHNETAAQRAYAQAAVIRAQSQARLDLAAALMPYTVIAVATLAVVALATLALAVVALLRQSEPARIIETRTVFLLAPGQTRREFWRQMNEVE